VKYDVCFLHDASVATRVRARARGKARTRAFYLLWAAREVVGREDHQQTARPSQRQATRGERRDERRDEKGKRREERRKRRDERREERGEMRDKRSAEIRHEKGLEISNPAQ
jgi:hypothetical protein